MAGGSNRTTYYPPTHLHTHTQPVLVGVLHACQVENVIKEQVGRYMADGPIRLYIYCLEGGYRTSVLD